jgi:cytochrome c556
MTKRLLGAMAVAVGLLVGVVGAADDKPPSISDVMKKVNGKAGLGKAVGKALTGATVDWDDVQKKTKEIAEQIEFLSKNEPPKGSKESWEKLTKAYAEAVRKLDEAAKKKDKAGVTATQTTIGGSCRSCHTAHRGS